jgi:DNA polymerase-3 subunit gamma/tau
MSNQPLIVRHRPATFADVRGDQSKISALRRRVEEPGRPHAYLFTGPSGVGKTTLARIIGQTLKSEVIEVDAASNNGVDAMRVLVDLGQYMAPGAQSRLIILDEAHMLSRGAFNAALKMLEEPPDHLYLVLCTTELFKIPHTIVTRCHHVSLEPLSTPEIEEFLVEILIKENWDTVIQDDVFQLIATESGGSPRQALSLLQSAYDAPSQAEARRIIATLGVSEPVRDVLRILVSGQGRTWENIQPLLLMISDDDYSDTMLIEASRYVIRALENETSAQKAAKLWSLVAAFVYPAHSYDPKSIFFAAIGRILWEA